jgi:hypothetical protein
MHLRSEPQPSLAELLAPATVTDFLAEHWRQRHLIVRGRVDRFSALLAWSDVNTILARHWREPFRFRLALQGRDLDPASYADLAGDAPRVRANDVTALLRRGATLAFHAVDDVHAPLTSLAESLDLTFHAHTQINIYAGCGMRHGLDLHRDDEEIFVLQIDGRKRWLLYGDAVGDLDRTVLADSTPPAGAAVDEMLRPGDLLYIPRGCYHLAIPMNEPTLHLTIGVKNPRGMDDAGSDLHPRPSFSLPWSATPGVIPAREFVVRLLPHARRRAGCLRERCFELRAGGRTFRFPRHMRQVLDRLDDGCSTGMGTLAADLSGALDGDAVRTLVAMLVKEGLAEVRA